MIYPIFKNQKQVECSGGTVLDIALFPHFLAYCGVRCICILTPYFRFWKKYMLFKEKHELHFKIGSNHAFKEKNVRFSNA